MASQPNPPSGLSHLPTHHEDDEEKHSQQQRQQQQQQPSDNLTLSVAPRTYLTVNSGPPGSTQNSPSLNGHLQYHNTAPSSPQVSPYDNNDDEHHDSFDIHRDLSPSPRSSVNSTSHYQSTRGGAAAATHNQNHLYAPTTTPVPDILATVDRTLLPIIAPFNFLDKSTLSERLATLNVTKQGFLEKRQSAPLLGSWRYNRRFVLIRDNQLRYDSGRKDEPLKGGMELRYVRVERSEVDSTVMYLDVSEWWKYAGNSRQMQGERRMEWKCESEEERESWVGVIEESKMMHEVYPLNKELNSTPPFPIILILGLPSSGKSTVFKHAMAWRPPTYLHVAEVSQSNHHHSYSSLSPRVGEQVKHAGNSRHRLDEAPQESEGYMPTEVRIGWRKRIFQHVLKGLCVLGDAVDEHAVSSEWVYAHQVLETEREKIRVDEDEHATLDKHTLDYIHRVWNEPLVKAAWERMRASNEWVKTLKPLLDKVDIMTSSEWIPSFQDVYHCYHALPIMTWKQVDAHSINRFRVYDIGGSSAMDRVDRWKLERFLTASLVFYTVDLTSFDKPSTVNPSLTLLQESLLLYQQLLANAMFTDWNPIHIYFTSADLLKEKLTATKFVDSVPGYDGGNDKSSVIRCVMGMYARVGGSRYVGRVVNAIDRSEMKRAIAEDIDKRREVVRARDQERAAATMYNSSSPRNSSTPRNAAASPRGAALSSPRAAPTTPRASA